MDGVKDFKTNKYRIDEPLAARIRAQCGDYIQRYGYGDGLPAEPAVGVLGVFDSRLH